MEGGKIYHGYTGKWHGQFPKVIATEEIVRERGDWLERSDSPGIPRGFIYYGKFEYLRPEIDKRMHLAKRRRQAVARRAKAKGGP